MKESIVETDSLSYDLLKKLFNDDVCVLIVRQYTSHKVCDKLTRFFTTVATEKYTHEIHKGNKIELNYYGVDRYGYPLNSTYVDQSKKKLNHYFKLALPTMKAIRNAAAPYLSPIDKLRVEFDEIWPHTTNLGIINGKKVFCGIGRIMRPDLSNLSAQQPHFDLVPYPYFPKILRQYAANIYLNLPNVGGELEIWNVPPINRKNKFIIPSDWRSILPESIKVKPCKGDLLLFNTCRPHAITQFNESKIRVSIQTFIGLSKDFKLFLWD